MKSFVITISLVLIFFTSPVHAFHSIHTPVDVLIDVGHGGVDGGTSFGNMLEKNITLQVATILYEQLENKGYTVAINRTGDYGLSEENNWLRTDSRHRKDLAQRKHLAKELTPKIMVSLHVNFSSRSIDRGAMVLYQKNDQSFMLADMIQHSLNNLYKASELPRKRRNLYILNHAICPTALIEMGYISNPKDLKQMTDRTFQKRLAQAISSAIDSYFLLLNHSPSTDSSPREGQ